MAAPSHHSFRPLSDREIEHLGMRVRQLAQLMPWVTIAEAIARLIDEVHGWRRSKEMWTLQSLPHPGEAIAMEDGTRARITSVAVLKEIDSEEEA